MTSLSDVLKDDAKRAEIIDACCRLIDGEVAGKGGISGIAVKAGYKVVQGVKPGFVRNVVETLLPEFTDALAPIVEEAREQGASISDYFGAHASEVADALLAVTDGRAANSSHGSIKGAYGKLRGSAKKNVLGAVPGLGEIIETHI